MRNVGKGLYNQTAYRLTCALTVVLSHLAGVCCSEAAKSHAVYDRIYTAAGVRDIPHTANVSHLVALVRSSVELPYFSIDNAHLMYNAHPKLFRHSF